MVYTPEEVACLGQFVKSSPLSYLIIHELINLKVYNIMVYSKMSSISPVFKQNAYVVTSQQRSYKFSGIVSEYDTVQKGKYRVPAVFSEKKIVVKEPFLRYIHHIVVHSKNHVQIVDNTNQKIQQIFSAQVSQTLIHITSIEANPSLTKRTSTWVRLSNGKKREYNVKFKNTPQAGYVFNKDGYPVKYTHLIMKNNGDYSSISGWWENETLGSFYLNSDGSIDDTKLNLDNPILFVYKESIECWQEAQCYTFVRSPNYCSVM